MRIARGATTREAIHLCSSARILLEMALCSGMGTVPMETSTSTSKRTWHVCVRGVINSDVLRHLEAHVVRVHAHAASLFPCRVLPVLLCSGHFEAHLGLLHMPCVGGGGGG